MAQAEPIHLSVGIEDVRLTTLDHKVVGKKVPLPERWLKGFAEVQVAAAAMHPVLDVGRVETRRFLTSFPRQSAPQTTHWVAPAGSGLRLTFRPSPTGAPLAGPERLRPFEPVRRFARGLRVYAAGGDGASAWEIDLDGARLVIPLSHDVRRGFSGEGSVLHDLSDEQAADDADLLSVLLAWEPTIDVDRLAAESGLGKNASLAPSPIWAQRARWGFDLAEAA